MGMGPYLAHMAARSDHHVLCVSHITHAQLSLPFPFSRGNPMS